MAWGSSSLPKEIHHTDLWNPTVQATWHIKNMLSLTLPWLIFNHWIPLIQQTWWWSKGVRMVEVPSLWRNFQQNPCSHDIDLEPGKQSCFFLNKTKLSCPSILTNSHNFYIPWTHFSHKFTYSQHDVYTNDTLGFNVWVHFCTKPLRMEDSWWSVITSKSEKGTLILQTLWHPTVHVTWSTWTMLISPDLLDVPVVAIHETKSFNRYDQRNSGWLRFIPVGGTSWASCSFKTLSNMIFIDLTPGKQFCFSPTKQNCLSSSTLTDSHNF